jgi:glucose/arabinose dehydrogenase
LCLTAGCGDDEPEPTTTSAPTAEQPEPKEPRPEKPPVGDGNGGVALDEIGDFEQPVYVTQPPSGDDALYVVEQCGRIIRTDGGERKTFLDVSDEVTCGGEQGLLSAAFAPDYERSGRFYVNYTDTAGDSRTVEYRRAEGVADVADTESARELLRIEDKYPNHNGGLLLFSPEGQLLLGMGDGGSAGDPDRTAQDLDSPLGKILAIHTEARGGYSVSAYGLRNPWRFSFDRETGALWIGDVGQDSLEEVDAVKRLEVPDPEEAAGDPPNFGWSAFEGTERFNEDQEAPGHVEPVLTYGRDGGCSITGGYVVRDPELESLYGRYLYGDFCAGELRSFIAKTGGAASDDRELGVEVPSLSSFGEDTEGHVYATSLDGPVYRLTGRG